MSKKIKADMGKLEEIQTILENNAIETCSRSCIRFYFRYRKN